jgi:arginine decarboxylase-like protein
MENKSTHEATLVSESSFPVQSKSNPLKTEPWTTEESAELYGINNWGNGYYRVNTNGNVQITPLVPTVHLLTFLS